MQSIAQIIDEMPQRFIEDIRNCDDSAALNRRLRSTRDPKKKIVIKERINNLNHSAH